MRVLYVLDGYPSLSESYVRTEIEHAVSSGIEVRVHARTRPDAGTYESQVPVDYGSSPRQLARSWKPDVIHHHFLTNAAVFAGQVGGIAPVTVRGHSVDYREASRALALGHVARVFLFPSLAARHESSKVVPVTAAFPSVFAPGKKDWGLVYRAAAGRSGKDLEGFVRVAAKLAGAFTFVLAVTRSGGWCGYVDGLLAMNERLGRPAEIMVNAPRRAVADLAARAGYCLRGDDPALHPYSMPASVAEAMGSGCVVLSRDCPEARGFVGAEGAYFKNQDEAAALLTFSSLMSDDERERRSAAAASWASRYSAPTALAPVLAAWREVAA